MSRGEAKYFTYMPAGNRINAETGLYVRDLFDPSRRGTDPHAKVRILEPEPDDGTPVAVVRQGKYVLAAKHDMKRNPKTERPANKGGQFGGGGFQGARGPGTSSFSAFSEPREVLDAVRYRMIDTTTGEVKPDIVKVPAGPRVGANPFAVSMLHDHLYVSSAADKALAVEAYELDGGLAWRKLIEPKGQAVKYSPYQLTVSPEGRYLVVNYFRDPEPPPPPEEPTTSPFGEFQGREREPATTARTGLVIYDLSAENDPEPALKVPDLGPGTARLDAISRDARLLAISHDDGVKRTIQVWDTATGRRLKTWTGSAELAFHPDKPLLAVLERVTEYPSGNEPVYKSVLGVWDFSEFVKP